MKKPIITFVLAFVPALPFGCDKLDRALDCADICSRYADCYNVDYDVGACERRCRDRANTDRYFSDQADACETCLDDRSCAGSDVCADDCAIIVPEPPVQGTDA